MIFYTQDKAVRISSMASDNTIWEVRRSHPDEMILGYLVGSAMLKDYVKECMDYGHDILVVRWNRNS